MPDPKVIVIGAGPSGLALALSLARRGRPVTVLERDPVQPMDDPASAFSTWSRQGVPHHRLPHSLRGRARRALRINAPDVLEAMMQAGARESNVRTRLVREAARPGDEDLESVHCSRPFFECVLRRIAKAEPLLNIVSNVKVDGLTVRQNGSWPPLVTGVRLQGAEVAAEVVVDAGGRRSGVREWLRAAGVTVPEGQTEPCGMVYYCRYFRLLEGKDYPAWTGLLGPGGTSDSARCVVFFGDNKTFSIVVGVPASVRAFRALARAEVYTAVVSRFKSLASFIQSDVVEPITGIIAMGSLQNVLHPTLVAGRPPVLGVHFIGDAYCHTNPTFAWGLCLGLDYGFRLGEIIDEHPADLEAQSLALADISCVETEQCFRAVAEEDRDRTLKWGGHPLSGEWLGRTFAAFIRDCAQPAAMLDPAVARAVLRRTQLLDLPDDLMKHEDIMQRITALQPDLPKPPAGSFPTRDELLELMRSGSPA